MGRTRTCEINVECDGDFRAVKRHEKVKQNTLLQNCEQAFESNERNVLGAIILDK